MLLLSSPLVFWIVVSYVCAIASVLDWRSLYTNLVRPLLALLIVLAYTAVVCTPRALVVFTHLIMLKGLARTILFLFPLLFE